MDARRCRRARRHASGRSIRRPHRSAATRWSSAWCPTAPLDAVRSVGNAAGAGAVRALLSMQARSELEAACAAVVKIETATEPQFQQLFVAAMAFPHATAPSPHLGARRHTARTNFIRRQRCGAVDAADRRTGHDVHRSPTPTQHRPAQRRACRAPGAARLARRRGRDLPDANDEAVRDRQRRGPRDHRAQRRDDPRRRSASRSATTRRRCGRSRDAGATSTASASASRGHVPADRAGHAPREYIQHARNPAQQRRRSAATPRCSPRNYGSPFVHDLDNGRRYATIEDFRNFVKLDVPCRRTCTTRGGTVCEPVDVPVSKRHLDMVYRTSRYSDKPFMGSVTRRERARRTRVEHGPDRVRRRPRGPHGHHSA